jgi:hypothetical protein
MTEADAQDILLGPPDPAVHLTRRDVIARLCRLTSKVMNERHGYHIPADCFCEGGPRDPIGGYQFDERIVLFVESAVDNALAAEMAARKL